MPQRPLDYPQPPPMAAGELEAFLHRAPIARLATHNADGTIHLAPIWFKYAGGHLLMPTQEVTRKVRNIQRDNAVSVLIDTHEPPYMAVLIYGRAELDYADVFDKKLDIYRKYFPEDRLPDPYKLAEKWVPVIIRVIPERVVALHDQRQY